MNSISPRAWSRSVVLLLSSLAVAAGCYTYVPVPANTSSPGSSIRAHLTDQGSADVAAQLGPGVQEIGGLLATRDDGSVSVIVEYFISRRQGELSGGNEAVRLPFDRLAGLEEKRLSRGRSILLGAAFVAGAFLVGDVFLREERVFEPDDPDDPGPTQLVIPIALPRGLARFRRAP